MFILFFIGRLFAIPLILIICIVERTLNFIEENIYDWRDSVIGLRLKIYEFCESNLPLKRRGKDELD